MVVAIVATAMATASIVVMLSRVRDRMECIDAFAGQQWEKAREACLRLADATGDSALGVRGARALFELGHRDEALLSAQRWFDSNDAATARQIAGTVYFQRDDHARAISLLRRALDEHVRRGDHEEAAIDAGHLAGALLRKSLIGDALDAAETAIAEADLAGQEERNVRLRGMSRMKLGKILVEVGDFSEARKMLWRAQQALMKWPADQAWAFLQLGMLSQAKDNHAGAAKAFEGALDLALEADVAVVATSARLNLARARRELGQLDAAERWMSQVDEDVREHPSALLVAGLIAADRGDRERADRLLDRAAADPPTDDYAMDIAVQRGRIAERVEEMERAEQHYREAIEVVEEMRGNTSSLDLRPWILARRRDPHRCLLSLLARQGRRVEALEIAEQLHARTWADALVVEHIERAGASGARARVLSAVSLGRRLQGEAARPLSSDKLLALLRGREALVYADTESEIWRFYIRDGAVEQLDRLPDRTRELLRDWNKTDWNKAQNDLALAKELGELLIPPAARAPSERSLYIVANGALDAVPFTMLRPAGRFLVEDRVHSRLQGIVMLRCPGPRQVHGRAVFLGDSRNDRDAARLDAEKFARALGGKTFVGSAVTRERLVESRFAPLLHLAIHAEVDDGGGRLLLANQQVFTVADILKNQLGPRVAVLAGCATAQDRAAESWGALSSAFLAAGSRSVVGTLWSVRAEDASRIMRAFYELGGERQPAHALARAQRELLAAEPSAWATWAPFVAYGSADPTDCE
jgi:tetratricopeptide (TPR) repeat protein